MSPKASMLIGASAGAFSLVLSFIGDPTSGTIVFVFASGALFGKGYGIWKDHSDV